MSVEIKAAVFGAIFGAIFGALVNVVIEIVKYFTNRRSLKKALRVGLYFEIDHHKIIEISKDNDGQPNFFIESFQNDFYAGNIENLTKLFSVDFLQHLTFYYSGMKSAFDHQDEPLKMNSKIAELIAKGSPSPQDSKECTELVKQLKGLKHILRGYLGPCLYSRQVLLTDLEKAFKKNPAELAYINVLPEHEEWWNKWKKD